ncbi:hypothetical protein C8R44DRAFT_729737 [Mycena epipterygia]|nr:hypothetical protein C8R44DRAFT_729737 [Mycena epipterygia]
MCRIGNEWGWEGPRMLWHRQPPFFLLNILFVLRFFYWARVRRIRPFTMVDIDSEQGAQQRDASKRNNTSYGSSGEGLPPAKVCQSVIYDRLWISAVVAFSLPVFNFASVTCPMPKIYSLESGELVKGAMEFVVSWFNVAEKIYPPKLTPSWDKEIPNFRPHKQTWSLTCNLISVKVCASSQTADLSGIVNIIERSPDPHKS